VEASTRRPLLFARTRGRPDTIDRRTRKGTGPAISLSFIIAVRRPRLLVVVNLVKKKKKKIYSQVQEI
jgi:hypothetical protein